MINNKLAEEIGESLGFDLIGFAPAVELEVETKRLEIWLRNGFQAGMEYMEKNFEKRFSVEKLLPEAESVISLGMNYFPGGGEAKENCGKISKYAFGTDYHFVIREKLKKFIAALREIDSSFEAAAYVDTGPVMDKAWAVRAGLGWQGKNTNVINPQLGSWFFIANIICNKKFSYSNTVTDHCGTCRACIDACPTNALQPYVLDSNKCISFLTIENKNEIPAEFAGKFDNWAFGCDICQDVCPWNIKFSSVTDKSEFRTPIAGGCFYSNDFENLSNSKFKKKFGASPVGRARLKGIKRNLNFLKKRI